MIPWYVYALGAVLFHTLFTLFRKKALFKVHSMNFESARSLVIALLALFLIPFANFNLDWKIVLTVYSISLIGTTGILFMSKAIKNNEISLVVPLSNIRPAFVALFAYIFLSETLQIKQFFGIVIVLVCAYLLESDHHFSDFIKPLKNMFASKYNIYFLIAVFLFSITAIADKYMVTNRLDIFTYFLLIWVFIAINFNVVHWLEFGFKDTVKCFKKVHYLPVLVGVFSITANLLTLKALTLTFVSLVTPVLMLRTLFVVIFGGQFFHEKYRLFRAVVSVFMLIGAYLVIV